MSKIAHSFEEMAQYLDLSDLPPGPAEGITEAPSIRRTAEPSGPLADLLAQLQSATATLASVVQRDDESKALALKSAERIAQALWRALDGVERERMARRN